LLAKLSREDAITNLQLMQSITKTVSSDFKIVFNHSNEKRNKGVKPSVTMKSKVWFWHNNSFIIDKKNEEVESYQFLN